MQFQHFGAFFKASWRANDWMWGRVDGVGWLIHMLLDPARLRRAAEGVAAGRLDAKAVDAKVDWLYNKLLDIAGGDPPRFNLAEPGEPDLFLDETLVRKELLAIFPLNASVSPPASLPFTALWMAARPQRLVAVSELPVLASQLTTESKPGR